MSETAWTPGLWTVRDRSPHSIDIFCGGTDIAFSLTNAAQQANPLANAHLIAAAPDLYSVLDEIFNYQGGEGCATDDPYFMDRARIALAKARGEVIP